MNIAVEGCMNGELDNVYVTLLLFEKSRNTKIDLLMCCGDFQWPSLAVLSRLPIPLPWIAKVNSSTIEACLPSTASSSVFTIADTFIVFIAIYSSSPSIASSPLSTRYHGGWAAPNIYFLGFAGVIKFGSVRFGQFERPPYNESDTRSIYHVREYDVHKLMQVEEPIDIFLFHDWPLGRAT
ncbi:hypothetical protein RJ641_029831 [Dillenia turbinata]|uniref:Uncharacterized protein n=1 Tax=Dillenia turbinata TaxID=194707 RepID=A0AAN8VUI2_9MAGN